MRKIFSVAACAMALTCAGASYAAIDAAAVKPVNAPFSVRVSQQVQQFVNGLYGTPAATLKSAASYEGSSRSRAAAVDSKAGGSSEPAGNAMLLAGVLIMGVIIKRRYGKGN